MNIAIITLFLPNYDPFVEVVSRNWEAYARRHNYGLCWKRTEVPVPDIGFAKIRFVRELLFEQENPWDAFFVMDTDILFTNFDIKIESFLEESPDSDYLVCTGFNGLCNGAFIIRKTEQARDLLDYMLANKYRHDNEQDTIKYHLDDPELPGRITLYPYSAFNSLLMDLYPEHAPATPERGDWQPTDFVLHLAGMSLDRRMALIESDRLRPLLEANLSKT